MNAATSTRATDIASLLAAVSIAACASGAPPAPPPATPKPLAPLVAPTEAPPQPAPLTGVWLGTLHAGKALRVQVHLDFAATPPRCALDSLDQGAMGIPCGDVVLDGSTLSLRVPEVGGTFQGTLSADRGTIDGTWTQQASPLPLVLTRQAVALELPKPALDPALPPVDLAALKDVLDKDLAAALASGALAPGTEAGVVIGVVSHGARRVLTYGAAKPDALFEIGSITKTFTGLILAQMVEEKKVTLDEPVRALLPPGTVAAPASGREITLVDLSAQRSGLPRMPDNFKPADPKNPYADYDAKALYAFVAKHGVERPEKAEFGYSNLGVGLLGQALADRAGTTYEKLVAQEVTGPLGMRDTVVTLTPALRARLAAGHDGEHHAAPPWDIDALAGAGAIRSTAADMLTYLQAQLHPERLPASARATREGRTLAAAIAASHRIRGEVGPREHIALNWFRADDRGAFWHNGATGGYSAYAEFDPDADFAVVVLSNTSITEDGFTDTLGVHVSQRLAGKAASSLAPPAK